MAKLTIVAVELGAVRVPLEPDSHTQHVRSIFVYFWREKFTGKTLKGCSPLVPVSPHFIRYYDLPFVYTKTSEGQLILGLITGRRPIC